MNATIQFTCPHCSHQIQLPSSTVGKQGKCPGCGQVVTITAEAAQMPPVNPAAQNQPVLVNPVDSPPTIPSSAPVVNPPEQVNSGDSPFAKLGQVVTGLQQHSRRTQGKKVNGWVIGGVIFGGMFLLSLIFSLSQMGIISNLRSDIFSSQSQSSSTGDRVVKHSKLSSWEDHPPPVLQAVRNGNEVFELHNFSDETNMYLSFENGRLVAIGYKYRNGGRSGVNISSFSRGDILGTYEDIQTETKSESSVTRRTGKKVSANIYRYELGITMEDKIFISKITHITIITMNPEVGEGFWKTTQTTLTDYRGRMADMEDIREVESFRGAVIPVKSP